MLFLYCSNIDCFAQPIDCHTRTYDRRLTKKSGALRYFYPPSLLTQRKSDDFKAL